MMNGIIIEDVFALALDIQMYLDELDNVNTIILSTYEEVDSYLSDNKVDFIISDIILDGHQKVFPLFEKHEVKCPIIFLTAYASDSMYEDTDQFNTFIYLVKPIQKVTIISALESLLSANQSTKSTEEIFFIKVKKKMIPIQKSKIVYISTEGNYCTIHTSTEEHLIRFTLGKLVTDIASDKIIRIHRNYAVNIDKVKEVDFPQSVCSINNVRNEFPIGRTYKKHFKSQF